MLGFYVLMYRLGLWFYAWGIRLAAYLGQSKARAWHLGRLQPWPSFERPAEQPCYWLHCASLGEYEQGRPLLETWLQEPENQRPYVVLSFFSPSGYEAVKHKLPKGLVLVYLPLDNPSKARSFIEAMRPDKAFFVKYEFWYFTLRTLREHGISSYLISAHFRPNQWFFKFYFRPFARAVLTCFERVFVQTSASRDLLLAHGLLGAGALVVAGDTRWDRVRALALEPWRDEVLFGFAALGPCLVAGSTWPRDEALLLEALQASEAWRLILVPHELDAAHLADIRQRFAAFKPYFYSEGLGFGSGRVLVLDRMGYLSRLYRLATWTYVGGGFGRGIHNSLEAAIYAKPLAFGPKHQKFSEAQALLQADLAREVASAKDLLAWLACYHDKAALLAFEAKAQVFLGQASGALTKILTQLKPSDETKKS